MTQLRWIAAAALSASACHLAVVHPTPIDHALPLLAVAVTLLAAVSYPSVMLAVPLLIAAEMALVDETTRLLAFGAILSAVTAVAMLAKWRGPEAEEHRLTAAVRFPGVAAVLIVVLRWIPLDRVEPVRELFLLAVCLAIVQVLGRTPFGAAIAVMTALVTPAVPLRTLALPLLVLGVAVLARFFGMARLQLAWPSSAVLASVVLFFAWSGVVARAFPWFLQKAEPVRQRDVIQQALPANASVTLDVPERTHALILSGANVARLPRGTRLGVIEPGGMAVRIGDASDWGYTRRAQFYGSRNPLPRDPAGKIRDYGYEAWVDGAGRITLPPNVRTIRVTADAALPPGASLQVEGFELR